MQMEISEKFWGEFMSDGHMTDDEKKALIEVASECFKEAGVQKTTMESIAEKAGIDLSVIRSEFKGKSHLALVVQARDLEELKREYLANMPDASVLEMTKFIIKSRCEFIEKHKNRTLTIFRNAFMRRQPWSDILDSMIWQLSVEFATLFGKGVREGEVRNDVDINAVVRAVMSFYLTAIVTIGLKADDFKAEEVWAFIEPQIDLLMDVLKP